VSSKPETTFYNSVHRHLPSDVYREKMWNMYRGGTPDYWFSGRRDLWVEYKFLVVPRRADTIIDLVAGRHPMLSHLQQHWLTERGKEGRSVWVIVGCKEGGVVMQYASMWKKKWQASAFRERVVDRAAVAKQIEIFVQGV
jgi:hypothetical protein